MIRLRMLYDEAMIQLKPCRHKSYHKHGEQCRYRAKPKHPVKVFISGGFSKRGATNVVIFTGIMDAEHYTAIFYAGLLPFVQ